MSAIVQLAVSDLGGGAFVLKGTIDFGSRKQRIKKHSRSLEELNRLKYEYEKSVEGYAHRFTRLTDQQLRDAELALTLTRGATLLDCVLEAEKCGCLPPAPKACQSALDEWLANQEMRGLYQHTRDNSKYRGQRFIESCNVTNLSEITPAMVQAFVYRHDLADMSKLAEGSVVYTFLRYCITQGWLRTSPFKVELGEIRRRAMHKHTPEILSPKQCAALLKAACELQDGALVPWVILSLWAFMREQEISGNEVMPGIIPANIRFKPDGTALALLRPHKTGTVRHRVVIIPKNVAPLLQDCITRGIWEKDRHPFCDYIARRKVRAAAGLHDLGTANRWGFKGISRSDWQANILRHTGISYLFELTKDIGAVCQQAGHSEKTAFAHYLHLGCAEDALEFYRISEELPAAEIQPLPLVALPPPPAPVGPYVFPWKVIGGYRRGCVPLYNQ